VREIKKKLADIHEESFKNSNSVEILFKRVDNLDVFKTPIQDFQALTERVN
jgi:hypothetical protein